MRERVRFTGRVQGVGFRAGVRALARRLPLTGWVRNEPDGSVLMEAQGGRDDIERLIDAIVNERASSITDVRRESIPDSPGETECDFVIRG